MTRASNLTFDSLKQAPTVWYLASPFNGFKGSRAAAAREACVALAKLVEEEVPAFSPIAHFYTAQEYVGARDEQEEHEFWMKACAPFMAVASGVLVLTLPGWKDSRGVSEEINFFQDSGLPVVYLDPQTMELVL